MLFNFFKNKSGARINPATDETLVGIENQLDLLTSDLVSDAGIISHNINVNVSAGVTKVQNTANTNINPATNSTIAAVQGAVAQMRFDSTSGLITSGSAPALASVVSLKDVTKTSVSPASDESVYLWSKMVKMMESKATVDAGRLKRVTVDSFGTDNVTGIGPSTTVGVSGSVVPLVTIASDFSENLTGLFTSTSYVGYNGQMYQDVARNSYAQGIRSKLNFS